MPLGGSPSTKSILWGQDERVGGVLFLVWPRELLADSAGRALVVGVGLCYLARAIEQPIFFDLSSTRSIVIFAICLLAAALHFAAVLLEA